MSTNPRLTAVKACDLVVSKGLSLPQALQQVSHDLSTDDKAFCQELAYGMLRFYHGYKTLLSSWLDKPIKDSEVELIIISGFYQLAHMRTPDHAATNETVKLAKKLKKIWAVKLINALLRRFLLIKQNNPVCPEEQQSCVSKDNGTFSHPQWLYQKIKKAWPTYADNVLEANNQKPSFQLRINLNKINREDYLKKLNNANIHYQIHENLPSAIQLDKAIEVKQLPGFFEGFISVQSYAAQWAGYLLEAKNHMDILDACAAPGGKTMHILELAPDAHVSAMDIDQDRLQRVKENLQRISAKADLIVGDVTNFVTNKQYDRILLDAPCSATGVISRHPDIKLLRRESDIKTLSAVQTQAINHVWSLLKPEGILLYATCSILPDENDAVIQSFLKNNQDAQLMNIEEPIGVATEYGRQLLPGIHGTDGFYYAKFKKA